MEIITQSMAGLLNFALYFAISIIYLFIFKVVYAMVTPHDEWKLVKQETGATRIAVSAVHPKPLEPIERLQRFPG